MKDGLLRILSGIMLTVFLFFVCAPGANAAVITKTLEENTKLIPSGLLATDDPPTFKKGTTVTLNENGEVIEGVLARDVLLSCVPLVYEENGINYFRSYKGWFNKDTKVIFNSRGAVMKGTTLYTIEQRYLYVPLNSSSLIKLKQFTEVSFHPNGMMAYGTTDSDTYLKPVGWKQITDNGMAGFVQFKGGRQIELNSKGEVLKGTLNKDTKLRLPEGRLKVYDAGTAVVFDDDGVVIKATKDELSV